MPDFVMRRCLTAVVSGACLALAPAAAQADSLIYVKGGTVYVAQADGSQARAVTSGANGWAWPSETDGGIIAVAGGVSRVGNGFDPSGSDEIYEFDQQGKQVAGPVATEGTYSTVADPEYVSHFRVAPDNSNVAWTDTASFSSPFVAWRNPNGSGSFSTANDSYGAPLPYSSPEWWGAGHILITHDGTQYTSNAEYGLYTIATGDAPGWSDDTAIGSASSYQVAISRSGLVFAVMDDDGPDYTGTIHNISIHLETTATAPTSRSTMSDVTDTGCAITLPASEFATNHGSYLASMSFSSDGSTLAWGQDDGVYEANVSNPSNCSAVQSSVHLVVPGGSMPFLGAAALSAPAPKPQPQPQPQPKPTPAGAPNTAIAHSQMNRHKHTARFTFRGSGGSGALTFRCKLDRGRWTSCGSPKTYTHLRKGKHTFQVQAVDHRGMADRTPASKRFTL
jgi:hypothetical protein